MRGSLTKFLSEKTFNAQGARREISNGAAINQQNKEGDSILMIAIKKGVSSGYVNWLVQKGADVHLRNKLDYTPLLVAAMWKNADATILKMLIRHGAYVNDKFDLKILLLFFIKSIIILDE